jgi:hypothetical protein
VLLEKDAASHHALAWYEVEKDMACHHAHAQYEVEKDVACHHDSVRGGEVSSMWWSWSWVGEYTSPSSTGRSRG